MVTFQILVQKLLHYDEWFCRQYCVKTRALTRHFGRINRTNSLPEEVRCVENLRVKIHIMPNDENFTCIAVRCGLGEGVGGR